MIRMRLNGPSAVSATAPAVITQPVTTSRSERAATSPVERGDSDMGVSIGMRPEAPERADRVSAVKIAVCVKQVPDATVHKRIDPATKRLDRSGEAALNPTDLNAVEEALRIKEAQGGEGLLVSLGPQKAVASLRHAPAL